MSRKLFTAGCVALIATGLVHLLGHYQLTTAVGETEHERQLFAMMRADPQDMGFGMMRTMFHFLTGFSLTFAVLPIGMGLAGFVVRRHAASAPGLLGQTGDRLRDHLGRHAGDRPRLLLLGARRLHRDRLPAVRGVGADGAALAVTRHPEPRLVGPRGRYARPSCPRLGTCRNSVRTELRRRLARYRPSSA